MYPMEKLIVGSSNGIYLIGNTSVYAEVLKATNFAALKIGNMGCNNLMPVNAEGNMIYVALDNKTVNEFTIAQDGGYVLGSINGLSTDLVKSGIIDHTWQQSPRKIYWCVTNDGALVGCSYDKNLAVRAWHDHVLGGKNTYVLQCDTNIDNGIDVLWLIVRREVNNRSIVSLEYLSDVFDPVEEEVFNQQYTDSSVLINVKYPIKNIENSGFVAVRLELEDNPQNHNQLTTFLSNVGEQRNLILFKETYDELYDIYDNANLNFYGISKYKFDDDERCIFFIDAYNSEYVPSEESVSVLEDYSMLFNISIRITSIENVSGFDTHDLIKIETEDTNFWRVMVPEEGDFAFIMLKDSGFLELDNRLFKIVRNFIISENAFFLCDTNNDLAKIQLDENEKLNSDCQLFFSPIQGKEILRNDCKDPKITFSQNVEKDEVPENAVPHSCRMSKIKGAYGYNGGDFNLKLDQIKDEREYIYGIYYLQTEEEKEKDPDELIKFVSNTHEFGIYDSLLEENGYAYFYFSDILANSIKHLVGQEICYTLNGNFSYRKVFTLTESMFEEGRFKLYKNAFSVNIGLPYRAELSLLPLSGGSLLGASEGCVGQQSRVVLMMYASLGGQYGPAYPTELNDSERLIQEIPYPFDNTLNKEKELVTASIRVPIYPNRDNTIRTVYLRSDDPLSFNVIGIVQDVNVSDG
jgi:hypothetical protein